MLNSLNYSALTALILLTVGCATQHHDHFIVLNAGFTHAMEHGVLQQAVANHQRKLLDREFVVTGHRITENTGVVIAVMKYSSGTLLRTDQAAFQKITIFLPFVVPHSRITLSEITGAIAYWSSGSSNFIGQNGCYGYANDGTLDFSDESSEKVTVSINATFHLLSPSGWEKECQQFVLREIMCFNKRIVSELTPCMV